MLLPIKLKDVLHKVLCVNLKTSGEHCNSLKLIRIFLSRYLRRTGSLEIERIIEKEI